MFVFLFVHVSLFLSLFYSQNTHLIISNRTLRRSAKTAAQLRWLLWLKLTLTVSTFEHRRFFSFWLGLNRKAHPFDLNFWTRRARADLIKVLELALCGLEGLPYVHVDLMSVLCSGSLLCHTSLGQTFSQKYGSTLCHPYVVGQPYVRSAFCLSPKGRHTARQTSKLVSWCLCQSNDYFAKSLCQPPIKQVNLVISSTGS